MISTFITALIVVGASTDTDQLVTRSLATRVTPTKSTQLRGSSQNRSGSQRTSKADQFIDLKFAKFDPLVSLPPVPFGFVADTPNQMFIVQYDRTPEESDREVIRQLGGEVSFYLPNNAYLVMLPVGGDGQLRQTGTVRWVGTYEPAYRVEPETMANLRAGRLGRNDYYIQVFKPDANLKASIASQVLQLGGRVVENPNEGSLMLVSLTPQQVIEVAGINGVVYFDRRTEIGTDMDVVRNVSGANFMESIAGYTGQGVIAHVIDSGNRSTHNAFDTPINRLTVRTNSTDTSHGTSTSGIVFGNGQGNASGKGMLPDCNAIFSRYQTAGWSGRLAWTQDTVNVYNAVIESNSWGDSLTGSYTTISAQMDEIIFSTDLLICQSMSNAGTNTGVRPQAWAKNMLSVGGIFHFGTATTTDDRWNNGASVGPAADGRIKPELSFFYDQILCTSNASDTSYTSSFGGTSAATPETAGAFGILFQMWSNGIFGNPAVGNSVFANRPKSTLAKAIMINQARQYTPGANGNDITRMRQGWGLPWLEPIWNNRDEMFLINERDVLTNGQSVTYRIYVPAGAPELKMTMNYMDLPAAASANPTRVNDLSIRAVSPTNVTYNGNAGLAAGPWSTSGGSPDTLNNTENIFVQNPTSGVWTITVTGTSIVSDARPETPGVTDADFALVVSGGDAQSQMESMAAAPGGTLSGPLSSLHISDNSGVTIPEGTASETSDDRRTMFATTTVPTTTSTEMRIGFEARSSGITTGASRISMFNNNTGQWEPIGFVNALTTTDRTFDIVVANGARFINGGRQVRIRAEFWNTDLGADVVWNPVVDQIRMTHFQP
ncbi:MAG: S8 family serine peptidase [Fimbriimonadaceae bacterium]|nr:S8 family serine peptidase [Fimbriimonadaceae bacterium]